MASDLRGFLRGHDVVLGYDFDTFVPGHLSRLGTREDVETQKAYFDDLVTETMVHLDDVSPARNAMDASIAADVFTRSHALEFVARTRSDVLRCSG